MGISLFTASFEQGVLVHVELIKCTQILYSSFLYNALKLPYHGTVQHTTECGSKLSVHLEKVTVHNIGISLLLSISVWVLLSSLIERRETIPTA